jgi:hypothetical protein
LYRTILSQSIFALKCPSIGKPCHQSSWQAYPSALRVLGKKR